MADRDELLSLGGPVLASYLNAADVLEVMVNDNGRCFVERFGQGKQPAPAPDFGMLERFICVFAHEAGKAWNTQQPALHAALADLGWRIEAGRPPYSAGLFMSLRKHAAQVFPLADFEAKGILTARQRGLLEQAVDARQCIIIAGGVGSAKTALLNACLWHIRDTTERVILAADDPEIQCAVADCQRITTTERGITLRELVKNTLRLNATRVVVEEVRGGECLDMLKCAQTGYGLMATVHVKRVEQTLSRLEQLVQEVSADPQRELIGSSVDLVVHMEKRSPSWRCTGLLAIRGYRNGAYVQDPLGVRDDEG